MATDGVTLSDVKIQWHAAFCAAAELELSENRAELDFQREYNLGRKPLQIDLLIVEKRKNVVIKSKFGRIFRRYNVIEYKSPGDELSIDDVIKAVGCACIYKSTAETVNQIPLDQITVSIVREGEPKKLFEMLNVLEEDAREFLERAQKLTSQGDREKVDAVLQVSVSANYGLYEQMKRRDPVMCEAMRRLMNDEIQESRQEGEQKGMLETLFSLVKDGILTIAEAARRANMKRADFEKAYKAFML